MGLAGAIMTASDDLLPFDADLATDVDDLLDGAQPDPDTGDYPCPMCEGSEFVDGRQCPACFGSGVDIHRNTEE
jgi:hypothetical protein